MYDFTKYNILLLLLTSTYTVAQEIITDTTLNAIRYYKINETVAYGYAKPKLKDVFRYIPKDLVELGKFTIQKENLKWDAIAIGSTLLLIPYDQRILNSANNFGNQLGSWDEDAQYDSFLGLRIIPKNIPSAVYYIGNGGTTLLLSGLFYTIGKSGPDDYRALNTSNELLEVLLSVGITTQTIKRITGRQSPRSATKEGGQWSPFPSFNAFQDQTPNYDAMPSGHLATYMATITIISINYPEIKWIKPVGYTVGGILAFNMISNKVHWASDYPVAILIGYVMGKNIANRRIIKKEPLSGMDDRKKAKYKTNFSLNRINNTNVIGINIRF
ncbi:phosphatase PAP2 family protein [Flavobacterium sp. SM15]|uniref:phosphatase PAP2 family protein n=1 Tax=Flavobacterium sp. SM15 TaxID=2908005 RepID=UPI001EDC61C7|nr:phosphatase PAP2 family protein [Flavobacterium sp. SM15]MCG2611937.1 phosphatase PAP2 family protein [Flavobacterium sp. SM15]